MDNWEFYGEAMRELDAETQKTSLKAQLIKDMAEEILKTAFEPSESGAGYDFDFDSSESKLNKIIEEFLVEYNDV